MFGLSLQDKRFLRRHGLTLPDVRHQARWFRRPSPTLPLIRPCSLGDGLERWSVADRRRLSLLAHRAASEGRLSTFVPASGAATRLFQSLTLLRRTALQSNLSTSALLRNPRFREARRILDQLPALALGQALVRFLRAQGMSLERLRKEGKILDLLDALLSPSGLGLEQLPKGMIPFHQKGGALFTAFEEHLRDAAALVTDRRRVCRVSFTVPPAYRRSVLALLRRFRGPRGTRFLLRTFVQSPSTDTLAVDDRGHWVRRKDGTLLIRPGGHGALLSDLEAVQTELVYIRNIDNVAIASWARRATPWRWALAGRLLEVREEARRWYDCLTTSSSPSLVAGAADFVRAHLGLRLPRQRRRAWLLRVLNRPWRVCGMIRNTGDPGGGPFWVKTSEGPTRQIVEAQQVSALPSQQKIFSRAGYFNPVDMVVSLRDFSGRRYRLGDFADPELVMVSSKMSDGKKITILERPGLWNGGMFHWNTVFVDMPGALFTPVKTLADFLRPGHRS